MAAWLTCPASGNPCPHTGNPCRFGLCLIRDGEPRRAALDIAAPGDVPDGARMTLLDAIAAVIDPSAFDAELWSDRAMNARSDAALIHICACREQGEASARAKVTAILALLRDPGDGVTAAPSYANGEWSRRNVEAYTDAILAEADKA